MPPPTLLRDEADVRNDDCRHKRDKINEAIRRIRVKMLKRRQQTLQHVNQLKIEIDMIQERKNVLSKELALLKELFMAQAGASQMEHPESVDLKTLLRDTTSGILDDDSTKNSSS